MGSGVRYVAELVVREYTYAGDRDVERIVAAGSGTSDSSSASPEAAMNRAIVVVTAALDAGFDEGSVVALSNDKLRAAAEWVIREFRSPVASEDPDALDALKKALADE